MVILEHGIHILILSNGFNTPLALLNTKVFGFVKVQNFIPTSFKYIRSYTRVELALLSM